MTKLSPATTDRVLEQMGLSKRPPLDFNGLSEIYSAWCQKVPFDNCRKMIACRNSLPGPLPGNDPVDFFEAWLQHGVGGTCWAVHGAWFELLVSLGFRPHRALCTMMTAPNLPPNHGSVIVEIEGSVYLVDVAITSVTPLSILQGQNAYVKHPAWGVEGLWQEGKFAVKWRALNIHDPFFCRIEQWPIDADIFASHHESTREWSPFNYQLNYSIVRDGGRTGIGKGEQVRIATDGTMTRKRLEDRLGFLVDQLGVSEELARQIPSDVPTPPPPTPV